VAEVLTAAEVIDRRAAVDEATLLAWRQTGLSRFSLWLAEPSRGFALADPTSDRIELSLVVHPQHRGRGLGGELARSVMDAVPEASVSAWSHGSFPAAAALAQRLGFERVRDLWLMRRALDAALPVPQVPPEVRLRTFVAGRDEEAFLAVNAAAFASHPEQGGLTRADLELRKAQPWFDAEGFLLAESVTDGRLLGFHWTKVHPGDPAYGEVYVVAVSPDAQSGGLGSALTLAGLHSLRSRGLTRVLLYVEADSRAVAVYERLGFTHADQDTDVQYVRAPIAPRD
jgi:mycothiol synthase